TSGNFASGNARITTTRYNQPDNDVDPTAFNSTPSSSSVVTPKAPVSDTDSGDAWLLERYSSRVATEGTTSSKVNYSFDSNGFLTRQRVLASGTTLPGNDTVSAYTQVGGNVT